MNARTSLMSGLLLVGTAMAAAPHRISTPNGVKVVLPQGPVTTEVVVVEGVDQTRWRSKESGLSVRVTTHVVDGRQSKTSPAALIDSVVKAKRNTRPQRTKFSQDVQFDVKGGARAWRSTLDGHGETRQTLVVATPSRSGTGAHHPHRFLRVAR